MAAGNFTVHKILVYLINFSWWLRYCTILIVINASSQTCYASQTGVGANLRDKSMPRNLDATLTLDVSTTKVTCAQTRKGHWRHRPQWRWPITDMVVHDKLSSVQDTAHITSDSAKHLIWLKAMLHDIQSTELSWGAAVSRLHNRMSAPDMTQV